MSVSPPGPEWTHRELNPDLLHARQVSSRWTMSPSVDRRGVEPRFPACDTGVFPLDEQPETEVRPGVEPGLPRYQRGVLPEHLQTVCSRVERGRHGDNRHGRPACLSCRPRPTRERLQWGRRDSNPDISVPQTDDSCQLVYVLEQIIAKRKRTVET